MARSTPLLLPPPTSDTVKAAIALLARIPKTWKALPELSALEGKALSLLTAAGLVECRFAVRFRSVGDQRVVATRFRFTGEAGLIDAVDPALAEAWTLWGQLGTKVYVEPGDDVGEWRLTEYGEQAAQEAANGDTLYLNDWLRTPGVPGVEGLGPLRFMPGLHRPVAPGEGHAERVEIVNTEAKPVSVKVENLAEVSGPLGDIARTLQDGMRRLEEAIRATKASAAAPENTSAPSETGPTVGRIWDKDYCPVCAHRGMEWISRSEFERRAREGDAPVKRETAGARIKNGAYCADATGRLPWCPVCKDRTPMGKGEREPDVDARQLPSQDQVLLYEEQCCTCAAGIMGLSKPPSLRTPPEAQEGKHTVIARDAARNALLAVIAEHRQRGRELTRDEVEAVATPAIRAFLEDHWDMEKAAFGDDADIENAIAASENPRPARQRGAPHKGEGRDSDNE